MKPSTNESPPSILWEFYCSDLEEGRKRGGEEEVKKRGSWNKKFLKKLAKLKKKLIFLSFFHKALAQHQNSPFAHLFERSWGELAAVEET